MTADAAQTRFEQYGPDGETNGMETGANAPCPLMKKYLMALAASLMLVSAAAFAVPSAGQIEQSMTQGNWQQADAQLSEVLQAHPDSAKAHYLYAQVLDREGKSAEALAQVQQAKTLDPNVKFTDPSRFNATEARIRANASRVSSSSRDNGLTGSNGNAFNQGALAAPEKHGPGMGLWIGLAVLIAGIVLVLRWGLKRARTNEDGQADTDRRTQLKRATELLNDVRSLKLDVRLSTQPGHEAMLKEVEDIETQLRGMVESLSNGKNPLPPYAVEDLSNRIDSVRARSEGRPDPHPAGANPSAVGPDGQSVYAQEAERFGRGQAPYSPYPPQQQAPVIVQQGGGFGGGMGGLLTGVLLGEAMSGGRERVIERDVPVDDERRRGNNGGDNGNNGGGLDFGNGSNDWSDNSGGGVDLGSNDNSSDWDNT
jgi:hypothetical protein